MSLKNVLTNTLNASRNTTASLQSLSEYLRNQVTKFERITSGKMPQGSDQYTAIALLVGDVDKVVLFNNDDLSGLLSGNVDEIEGRLNESGDTLYFTYDQVSERITDLVSEAQVQSCFIETCLSSAATTVESFISSVKNQYEAVSTNVLSTYADLFRTGDKIQALKSWVSTIKIGEVVNQSDQYIQVVDRTEFTGTSVWNVVINDFVDSISGFFEKIWQGINDIKGFFERLWDGLVRLGSYLLSKAFRYLTSNLSAGESKIGILDYPICSIKLGSISRDPVTQMWNPSLISVSSIVLNSCSRMMDRIDGGQITLITVDAQSVKYNLNTSSWIVNIEEYIKYAINRIISKCCITEVVSPDNGQVTSNFLTPIDILAPAEEWASINGFVIRIGCIENGDVYMSIYASVLQDMLDGYTDAEFYNELHSPFEQFIRKILIEQFHFPVYSVQNTGMDESNKSLDPTFLVSKIMTSLSGSESGNVPVDFATHFKFLYDSDITDSEYIDPRNLVKWGDGYVWLMIFGFLSYALLMSPGSDNDFVTIVDNHTDFVNTYAKVAMCQQDLAWTSFPLATEDRFPSDWNYVYKPYLSNSLTPSSIHFQSLSERAKEIEISIIAIIIACAAVKLSVKLFKYRKKLMENIEIARGQCDNKAWTMDPNNPDDVADYITKRKKARKLERWGRLFGLSSKVATSTATSAVLDTIGGIGCSSGKSTSTVVENNSDRIYGIITGE